MIRTKFEEQLNELGHEMLQMGMLCETTVKYATQAVLNNDRELAEMIAGLLEQMNQEDKDIESTAMKLLLTQQPVAGDLRYVSSSIKIVTDLKRIGVQSNDIGEIVTMGTIRKIPEKMPLRGMAETVIGMVSGSIDAFAGKKLELAKNIIKRDDIVDRYFDETKQALIAELKAPSSPGESAEGEYGAMILDLLMVAKYLERIGDHAVNMAGWVCFMISGKREGLK